MHFWPHRRKERPSVSHGELSERAIKERKVYKVTIPLPEPTKVGNVSLAEALNSRRSIRDFLNEKISDQQLSDLLWAASGVNLIKGEEENKRYFFTNPTASNHREISVYVFSDKGIFLYEPIQNELLQLSTHDYRNKLSNLSFVKNAALSLCIVSDIAKMVRHKDDAFRQQLYSSMDAGYVSENIYLHCAANGFATCACGLIDRERISKILGLSNTRVMLVHPIGIKKEKR